jgi:23S rRNA (cytosine1962-C5)-methyltransferase
MRGHPAPVEIEVREDDLRFSVDVTAPLSTGLFADLREGRRVVRKWAKDRSVLNLFSYTGAISVYARAGGAKEIVAVDVSAKSHARARKNFALSGFSPEGKDGCEFIVADAMKSLTRFSDRSRRFDMIVIDPPAFASGSKGGRPWAAVRDYSELCAACLGVLNPNGILVAASSTHRLSWQDFDDALAEGAAIAKTSLRIVDRASLPLDFPTSPGFPEGDYLKFAVCARG